MSQVNERDFPLVVDSHCLHCIIGEDRAKFYAKVQEHLKAGGIFVVNTMCRNSRSNEITGFQPKTGLTLHGDLATRFIGSREEIEAEVKAAGFTIVESRLMLDEDGVADDLLLVLQSPS
ncbi:MAG: hypothetical protein P1V97_39420 [Planctomycetota bacterium]|nr:hypothetical protein [Planctomycetota bacterium]